MNFEFVIDSIYSIFQQEFVIYGLAPIAVTLAVVKYIWAKLNPQICIHFRSLLRFR